MSMKCVHLAQCRRQKSFSSGKSKSDGRTSESSSSKSRSPRRPMATASVTESTSSEDLQPSISSSSVTTPSSPSFPLPVSLPHTMLSSHYSLPDMSRPPPATFSSTFSFTPPFFSSSSSIRDALPYPMWSSSNPPYPPLPERSFPMPWMSQAAGHSASGSMSLPSRG